MSSTDIYNRRMYICLPHQIRSAQWIEEILHHLWNYGMNFPNFKLNGQQPLTWNELRIAIDIESGDEETFQSQIARIAKSGGYLFLAHDLGWPSLGFELGKHTSLDWLVLSVRGLELEPYWNRKQEQYETPLGYLAVYQAFLEWARVLCEIVKPLFGFGYCERYLSNFDAYYEYVRVQGELPQPGQIPQIDNWFSHPPLRYFAPALLTSDLQNDLLSRENWQLQRLTTGGLFVTPPDPEYTYLAYAGYHELHYTDTQSEASQEGQSNVGSQQDLAHEELFRTQRAHTIFTAINNQTGMHKAQSYLSSLETYQKGDHPGIEH